MVPRRLIAAGAVAVAVAGCGSDGRTAEEQQVKATVDSQQEERRAKVQRAVDAGRLPPVALELFRPNGTVNVSFIDGPGGYEDVVRTENSGRSGPKLKWDLDQDGKISADEREITEQELYEATVGLE